MTLDWWLGLDTLSLGDDRLQWRWAYPLPAWAWLLIAAAALALATWSYHRLIGRRAPRIALAMLRALLLVFLAVLIAGPELVIQRERVEPDTVVMLVDRSASMRIPDERRPEGRSGRVDADPDVATRDGSRISRDQALREALAPYVGFIGPSEAGETNAVRAVGSTSPNPDRPADGKSGRRLFDEDRRVLWLGFDRETFELPRRGFDASAPAASPGASGSLDESATDADARPDQPSPSEPDRNSTSSSSSSSTSSSGSGSGSTAAAPSPSSDPLGTPEGAATRITAALEQAIERLAGRPVGGVVLLSDGRSPDAVSPDLLRRLNQQAIGVFPVPLGAAEAPLDLAIDRVDAPDKAFINEPAPIRVWINRSDGPTPNAGAESRSDPTIPADGGDGPGTGTGPGPNRPLTVRLIDAASDRVLDEKTVEPEDLEDEGGVPRPVRLVGESQLAGPQNWRVELAPTEDELLLDNNTRTFALELIDRPIRVLLIEGVPRWEYRYLKNLLVRENSVESSVLLSAADATFVQEGDLPITRMPSDTQELEPYDVVVIGDVPPAYFSDDQMSLLRDHVAVRGAGLLWIGGPVATPHRYDGTALADLLPMRRPAATQRIDPTYGPIALRPEPLAEQLGVLQLDWSDRQVAARPSRARRPAVVRRSDQKPPPPGPNEPLGLPPLRWAQDIGPIKPTTEILASGVSADGKNWPLVLRLRFGAGQAYYIATDETWRLRYGRGERIFEQFWLQFVQLLGRAGQNRSTDAVVLDLSHRRVRVGEPIVVRLIVRDRSVLARPAATAPVEAVRRRDQQELTVGRFELARRENAGRATRDGDDRIVYEAIWRPPAAGRLTLRINDPTMMAWSLEQGLEVIAPDDEMRQIAADHERLQQLAQATGGRLVPLHELHRLNELVPDRARRTPLDLAESIWDSPLALLLVTTLLTTEWIGRKIIRLV